MWENMPAFRTQTRQVDAQQSGKFGAEGKNLAWICELTDSEEIFATSSGPGVPMSLMINFN